MDVPAACRMLVLLSALIKFSELGGLPHRSRGCKVAEVTYNSLIAKFM